MILSNYTKEFNYNLKLAYPVILGMLGHTLVAFVDNVMVGQLGTAELAAVSLANSFMFIAMSLGIGFSTAITPLVAAALSYTGTGPSATANTYPITAATHGLGSNSAIIMVQLVEVSTGQTVYAEVVRGASGLITVNFGSNQAANTIRVLMQKIG